MFPDGGKWWRFKYRFDGKEKGLAPGVYPDVKIDGKECAVEVRTNDILKDSLVGTASRCSAGDAGIGEYDVELAEIFGKC